MPRYFLELAYKGTHYHGWQVQINATSVQENLNKALSILCRTPIETVGCGRTDTAVHSSQFFAHFVCDLSTEEIEKLQHKLNAILNHDIVIYQVIAVAENAHARFDATKRSYSYYISREKNPFLNEQTWYWSHPLDINLMNEAASLLLHFDDYGCFSKSGGQQHTTICKISEAKWIEKGNLLQFTISANRFLRGMVRAIVGTLIQVGEHKITLQDFENIIKSQDRTKAGQSVPAEGLFLEEICYPYIHSKRRSPFHP